LTWRGVSGGLWRRQVRRKRSILKRPCSRPLLPHAPRIMALYIAHLQKQRASDNNAVSIIYDLTYHHLFLFLSKITRGAKIDRTKKGSVVECSEFRRRSWPASPLECVCALETFGALTTPSPPKKFRAPPVLAQGLTSLTRQESLAKSGAIALPRYH
jgi:hypothetical protein